MLRPHRGIALLRHFLNSVRRSIVVVPVDLDIDVAEVANPAVFKTDIFTYNTGVPVTYLKTVPIVTFKWRQVQRGSRLGTVFTANEAIVQSVEDRVSFEDPAAAAEKLRRYDDTLIYSRIEEPPEPRRLLSALYRPVLAAGVVHPVRIHASQAVFSVEGETVLMPIPACYKFLLEAVPEWVIALPALGVVFVGTFEVDKTAFRRIVEMIPESIEAYQADYTLTMVAVGGEEE